MHKPFFYVSDSKLGKTWLDVYSNKLPYYYHWYYQHGDLSRPGYLSVIKAMETYMPELVPMWERLVQLFKGNEQIARLLSFYCPPPVFSGCSQLYWDGDEPCLIRNYDFHPQMFEAVVLSSCWHGTKVMGVTDCIWGVLDGMNEHGLALSLSFGGRKNVGEGFGIPLIMRYVLEFCKTMDEAIEVFKRVPCYMSYNITIVTAQSEYVTLQIGPDYPTKSIQLGYATNHQSHDPGPHYSHFSSSVDRANCLDRCSRRSDLTLDKLIHTFFEPPMYLDLNRSEFRTLYTVVYKPRSLTSHFIWQEQERIQSFSKFEEGIIDVVYA